VFAQNNNPTLTGFETLLGINTSQINKKKPTSNEKNTFWDCRELKDFKDFEDCRDFCYRT
jgi:hypothetical protein